MSRFHDPAIGALLILCVIYLLAGEVYDWAREVSVPELSTVMQAAPDPHQTVVADQQASVASRSPSLVAAKSPLSR